MMHASTFNSPLRCDTVIGGNARKLDFELNLVGAERFQLKLARNDSNAAPWHAGSFTTSAGKITGVGRAFDRRI